MAGVGELKSEANIQQLIRLALAEAGHVVFRNNSGGYKSPSGRWLKNQYQTKPTESQMI